MSPASPHHTAARPPWWQEPATPCTHLGCTHSLSGIHQGMPTTARALPPHTRANGPWWTRWVWGTSWSAWHELVQNCLQITATVLTSCCPRVDLPCFTGHEHASTLSESQEGTHAHCCNVGQKGEPDPAVVRWSGGRGRFDDELFANLERFQPLQLSLLF